MDAKGSGSPFELKAVCLLTRRFLQAARAIRMHPNRRAKRVSSVSMSANVLCEDIEKCFANDNRQPKALVELWRKMIASTQKLIESKQLLLYNN
jgi:hypothetical protein